MTLSTPTTGYQASPETSQTLISYAPEVAWGVLPAVQFQAIRYNSETLGSKKTRTRPGEILASRAMAQAVTTQVEASGGIAFSLSYGTYDDLLSGVLGAAWAAPVIVAGVAGDLALSSAGTLTSTTSGKFTSVPLGAFVRLKGFTNAANNCVARVTAKTSTVLTLAGPAVFVTETPTGTTASVTYSNLRNGLSFYSFFVQKKLATAKFLTYPGTYFSDVTLQGGVGKFLEGSFTTFAQQEIDATVNSSTGTVSPAPTGNVLDTVKGFQGFYVSDVLQVANVNSFALTISNSGAATEHAMGSAAAVGVLQGSMMVSGTLELYFGSFTLYDRFQSETQGPIAFVVADNSGNTYAITVLNAALMDPTIQAGGPNQSIMVKFTIEGNPDPVTGAVVQIDRL